MRETHVLLESVWELLKKDQSGHPNLWKATNYDVHKIWPSCFLKCGHKLHTKKQWLRLSLRTIQYGTNTHKRYFYTFRINQITSIYGEGKKERPNFYGMFRQSLLNSAAFTAILKMKLPQCNAIEVRTPPGRQHFSNWPEPCSHEGMFSSFVFLMKNVKKKFSLLKEPISSLFAYTHRRPRLTERKRTLFTLRERKAVCETKSDALHVQANSYTTFSETWLSSPSVWKCCVGKFLFHEGIYEEKRIHNILLFSLHNH